MHVHLRRVPVHVFVVFCSVLMRVRMNHFGVAMRRREAISDPLRDSGQTQNAKQNQHQTDSQFHRQPDFYRDRQIKKDNPRANEQDGDGMTQPPECSDQAGMTDAVLAADDCRDGDYMIGVGCVSHPEQESESDNGEQVGQSAHWHRSLAAWIVFVFPVISYLRLRKHIAGFPFLCS